MMKQELDMQTNGVNDCTRKNLMQTNLENKTHYDKKQNADKLQPNDYFYIPHQKSTPKLQKSHSTNTSVKYLT